MRVLLIYYLDYSIARYKTSRAEFPPMGLMYLCAAIEKAGFYVEVISSEGVTPDFLKQFDVVGLSINSAFAFAKLKKLAKKLRSNCKYLVIGGQQAIINLMETFNTFEPDFVVCGEGEISFTNLLIELNKDLPNTNIIGIVTSNQANGNIIKPLRIKKLNDLAMPARHLFPMNQILLQRRFGDKYLNSLTIITSRGCPFNCSFCGNAYKEVFFRNEQNIWQELQFIKKVYGPEGIIVMDENILFSDSHMKMVASNLSKLEIPWMGNARVDFATLENLEILYHSGCVEIKFGIESGNQAILDRMQKGITLDQIKNAFTAAKLAGLKTKGFLMFGFPGDSYQTAIDTIEFLKSFKDKIDYLNMFSFAPLPGSHCYRNPEKYSLRLIKAWENQIIYRQNSSWWGNIEERKSMLKGKKLLEKFIKTEFDEIKPKGF